MFIKSIRQIKNLVGKKVLLRTDFNVPIEKSKIKDDYKIITSLPTIRYLLRHKCKIIIISHLGEPNKNKKQKIKNKKYSIKPLVLRLSQLLGKKIKFVDDCFGEKVALAVNKLKFGEILLLENLRFYPEEENNDKKFAKKLAKLADIYINDAFAVCHRNHASVSAIKKYLPSFAGLLIASEVYNLNKILKPVQPLISIIGGVKIESKAALINKLIKKSYRVLIGGALANNFIAAHDFNIGKSLANETSIKLAGKLKNEKIILPIDVVIAKKFTSKEAIVKNVNQVTKSDIILDIGPRTIKLYAKYIKIASTLIWNGPMGYFENEHFKHGTLAIARLIASRSTGSAFGVVGGGETVEALKMTKMIDYIDWVSTGGGAMLTYLAGEKMPGLKGIVY
jgi:phosphoglycerate kinase